MIEFIAETGSTNSDLLGRLRAGEVLNEGVWLVADRQTQGRGRGGRAWIGASGNLFASTVITLLPDNPPAQTLSFVASLALLTVIEREQTTLIPLQLKWPNDLLVGGSKLSGILLERMGNFVVVGIGVNIATAPALDDRRTTSLAANGIAIDRNALAELLVRAFASEVARWRTVPLRQTFERWQTYAHPLGADLLVHEANGVPRKGTYAGLSPDGALLLRLADGTVAAITAGDVSLS